MFLRRIFLIKVLLLLAVLARGCKATSLTQFGSNNNRLRSSKDILKIEDTEVATEAMIVGKINEEVAVGSLAEIGVGMIVTAEAIDVIITITAVIATEIIEEEEIDATETNEEADLEVQEEIKLTSM